MSTTVQYKNATLTTVNNTTKVLTTAGKYLEDNITLVDVSSGGSAAIYQDENGYLVLSDEGDGSGGYARIVVCPQQNFTGSSSDRRATLTGISEGFVDGAYYIVTYDGVEWLTTCETLWSTNLAIGEVQWFLTTLDSIYPFGVIWESGNTATVAAANTSQHTIKIERLEFVGNPSLTSKTITANGTYNASTDSVDGYSSVTVNVASGTPTLQNKTINITPTESAQSQTVTADNGYDGLDEVQVNVSAVSSTYVGSGVSRQVAQTIHPSTSDQTIASNKYLTGAQTIKAVTTSNLTAANIKSGVVVQVGDSTDSDCVASVTGTYSGGGSSNFTLLGTLAVGAISTTSTTATDTGKSITVKGIYDYDLLVCECSVDTKTNGRHIGTTRLVWLTGSSDIETKNGATFTTATWNAKISSSGVVTSRSSTTQYGIYAQACTVSEGSTGDNGQAVITIYQRYHSTQTGTINGSYTMRVYGVKIYDLIGG